MNVKTVYENLDKNKYDILNHGYAFDLVIIDRDGTPYHSCVGTAEQVTLMDLISITDLYKYAAKGEVNIEDYAESVKESIIRFYNEHRDFMQGELS